jgi:hypothetical protein
VENAAVGALVGIVLKLSESQFKPLFLKTLEWLADDDDKTAARTVTFFALVSALVDALKARSEHHGLRAR